MGDDKDKELARAQKIMGAPWVAHVRGYLHCCFVFRLILVSQGQKEVIFMSCRPIYTCADQCFLSGRCRFTTRALATEMFDFADEADEPEATCPVCKDCE